MEGTLNIRELSDWILVGNNNEKIRKKIKVESNKKGKVLESKVIFNNKTNRKNRNKPLIIGVCYDFQLIDYIPSEDHDIKMDYIVTEKNILI